MTPDQEDLIEQMKAIGEAVAKTTILSSVLEPVWFKAIEKEILASPTPSALAADRSGFIRSLCHPLRGTDWFEADQHLLLEGRRDEIDADGRFALAMCGVDPVRTFIPLLERRLNAFATLPFKQQTVKVKIEQLRTARSDAAFKNHLFEVNVLGDLALKGALRDIEESTTAVDGVIDLAGREILIEATNTVQEVIPRFLGVFSTDPNVEIDQVVKKLHKKVAEGRQLALSKGRPTLLLLALTPLGAGRDSARIAMSECFRAAEFAALSGVVLADSWRFQVTSWHPGEAPDTPLSDAEKEKLREWYAQR
ncbi:MAG: hypothetical protein ACRD2L_21445 [Terriglobia bacterium]